MIKKKKKKIKRRILRRRKRILKKAARRRRISRRRRSIFKRPRFKNVVKEEKPARAKETPTPKQKRKISKELSELIALGKEKGHLTFEEVNNILPVEIVSSEEIDEILGILGDENIRLVDSEEELAKEAGAVEGGEIQEEKKEGAPKEEISR